MENVKTFDSILNVEAGKTQAFADVADFGFGMYDAANVFGKLNGAYVRDFGYLGVGQAGATDNVVVGANGEFKVWANAKAERTTVWGVAANTGKMYVFDGAKAQNTTVRDFGVMFVEDGAKVQNTTVNANGAMHLNGIAYDTIVNGGYAGVGANGVADDITITIAGGNVDVFNGGTVVEANVGGGVMTLWSGAKTVDADVTAGEIRVGNGALLTEETNVSGTGDLVFYESMTWAGYGEIELDRGGAINTWGQTAFNGTISFDMTAPVVTDKVRVDDLAAIYGVSLEVEADSWTAAGRYLIAGNASAWLGSYITFTDSDIDYVAQIGGLGIYANDKTYCFNIDANDNLYMDVVDGNVVAEYPYQANNSVGAGYFGTVAGTQIVWTNEDKSALGIAGVGNIVAAGEFAGIGDFDGNRIDDILFANGNDLICTFLFDDNGDSVVDRTYTHTYTDLLSYGTMDDFQVGNVNGGLTEEVFLKADNEYFAFNLIDNTKDAATDITAYSAVMVPNKFACVK